MPLVLQIALVSDDDNWERVLVLHTQNLLVESANFLERIAGSDGVDQEETLARAHVLFAHSTDCRYEPRDTPARTAGLTHILLDQRYPRRRGEQPHRRSRTVSGMSLQDRQAE